MYLKHFINNAFQENDANGFREGERHLEVTTPYTGEVIGMVPLGSGADVDAAVASAKAAFPAWSGLTIKARAAYVTRFTAAILAHADELADLVVREHGKTKDEALASVNKGAETADYAAGLPLLWAGSVMEVSRGVRCEDRREAIGVVGSIVPFNFPIMVPMWTTPIAIACGNTVVLKPSEKVPMTLGRIAAIAAEIFPPGVFNLVHGDRITAEHLVDHPDVRAVTFVGTSAVAKAITERARGLGKRVLALGGAKNHLVAAPDCDIEMTAADVVASFSGCAGERCMAASVLLTVGEQHRLVERIVEKARAIQPGSGKGEMGPVIDAASRDRINGYIQEAEASGARILLDGRGWGGRKGFWTGPTVILHSNRQDRALHEEIFGPVLSILPCANASEALEIENANPYGNAACIYTQSGAVAEHFTRHFSAGMMGVNIGVPVPREPFSFGGINASSFADQDITGDGGLAFFTRRKKVTTKWTVPEESSWMS